MRSLLVLLVLAAPLPAADLNVLFIAVDDLRPEFGCYGHPVVKSPNLDRLAARGVRFDRAYCQQAVCSPSRSSILTGRRPDTTKVYDLVTHFRKAIPDVVTLPQLFKQGGYHTQAIGKLYHPGYDDEPSWSVPHQGPKKPNFGPDGVKKLAEAKEVARAAGADVARVRGLPWEAPDLADTELADGSIADQAVAALEKLAADKKRFFLAAGFLKPHLPFVAPKKYWDLYAAKDVEPRDYPEPPKDVPPFALQNSGELRAYLGMPANGALSKEQARNMIHGYYACVSYLDAQVGRLLDTLDRLKLADSTVVVLWGDHGWHLGDHGMWCKHSNYEKATRVPLLVAVPGLKTAGQGTMALVEFVDVYPTLAEVCGLKAPDECEGTSFVPVLKDVKVAWKKAAFSQYPRPVPNVGRVMGYAVRTERYRLVAWENADKSFAKYELYDYQADPDEKENHAGQAEYAERLRELQAVLKVGWKGAKP